MLEVSGRHVPSGRVLARFGNSSIYVPSSVDVSIALMACALGVLYALSVIPGLPYDEPSHWSNVLYYANRHSVPVLGHPGVTYEAQMGPVAYALDGAVVDLLRELGLGISTAFRIVRMIGVVEFGCSILVLSGVVRRLARNASWASAALAVYALNPMLLCMSASVQNDTLALLLGLVVIRLALEWWREPPSVVVTGVTGLVAGLAVLTKLTAWAVVIFVPLWVLWYHRRAGIRAATGFFVAAAAVSGWWFVRNLILYGDPTAAAGVKKTGVVFGPYHVRGLSGLSHTLEEVVTYLWVPTEYVRNTISAPLTVKATLLALSLVILVAGVIKIRRPTGALSLVAGCAVIAFASWLVTYVGVQAVAPRVAYLALPLWIYLAGLTVERLPQRFALSGTVILMAALNGWTLSALSGVSASHLIIFPH